MVLEQVVRVIIITTAAFFVALATTPAWLSFLSKHRMQKQIRTSSAAPVYNKFHEKKAGTPTSGGIIVWSTVAILAFVFWVGSYFFDGAWKDLNFIDRSQTYLPLATLLGAALVGLVDDWFGASKLGPNGGGLKVRHKLLVYTVIAAIGAWWFYYKLGRTELVVPFLGALPLGAWYMLFFVFVIVATAFSANETDGLDGLFGGTALFAFLALTAVAFSTGLYHLAVFGGATIGALLAFLWFNIYPAKFFMGDTGSMSLGITIGVIAMLTNTALLLPLFAFILVVESLSVIIQLTSKKFFGRKVFLSTPIHHHFEAIGWHESQITMRFWIISAVASSVGLVLFFLSRIP